MTDAVLETQAAALASFAEDGVTASSQFAALVSFSPPATNVVGSTQLSGSAAYAELGIPASTQVGIMAAYRTGSIGDFTLRAWGFTMDGHALYVLTLGEQGTFVYDKSTGQWSKFQTSGLDTWNMEQGITWKGNVIAGDNQNPVLWKLDYDSFLDDGFKPMTRVATGGLPVRQRAFARQFSFALTYSTGSPSAVDVDATPIVSVRFSDDAGNTWTNLPSITLQNDAFSQEVNWRSLGSLRAPGRVFEISDFGGFVRLDGADADVEGFDSE